MLNGQDDSNETEDQNQVEQTQTLRALAKFNATSGVRARVNNMEVAAEFAAFHYLAEVLRPDRFMPTVGGWSVQYQVIASIVDHLLNLPKPRLTVVEVGSGISTSWLGLALEQIGNSRLVSLEHDYVYAQQVQNQLKRYALEEVVELVLADLVPTKINGTQYSWYSADKFKPALDLNDKIDLVFVDGPPGHIGHMSRYPAFEILSQYMHAGTRIILDDTDRAEEKEVVSKWINECPHLIPGHKLSVVEVVGRSTVLEIFDN